MTLASSLIGRTVTWPNYSSTIETRRGEVMAVSWDSEASWWLLVLVGAELHSVEASEVAVEPHEDLHRKFFGKPDPGSF